VITQWWQNASTRLRARANYAIRSSANLHQGPPPFCNDPSEAYGKVDGFARVVHGDLASMLIGGLGSLFLQMLHPHAMAGVADHSRYREDPLGRLLSTANFISATTYGSKESARVAIDRVLKVHTYVNGVADDGVAYDANDPHLLLWVHCAEISMFLAGYQRYGKDRLSRAEADQYVEEMVPLARDLGVENPPTTVKELNDTLASFRPELRLSADGALARDFLAHDVLKTRTQRAIYHLLVLSAWRLLDPYSRQLLGVRVSWLKDRFFVRPATAVLVRVIHFAVPPPPRVTLART